MLAIRLPKEIEKRLEKLARKTGRTKTWYAREAILEYIENLEDYYTAERAYREFIASGEKAIPVSELKGKNGLQD
jgi:RHH-type rel operon transcriptional repressor/antitoxin RelB